jgi:hypothetical protein
MTNGKNLESRTKPFENGNGKEEPKRAPIRQSDKCGWYLTFNDNPKSMSKETMEDFIKKYGCYDCDGCKTPCGGRA